MILMTPEDLRTPVVHRRKNYFGEDEPFLYGPFWIVWPDYDLYNRTAIDWYTAQVEGFIPHCPLCDFPLTPTGYRSSTLNLDDNEEYYICRFCKHKVRGYKIRIAEPEPEMPKPKPEARPILSTIDQKYRYLLKG